MNLDDPIATYWRSPETIVATADSWNTWNCHIIVTLHTKFEELLLFCCIERRSL